MIRVYTDNPATHLQAIIDAADDDTSRTWSHHERTFSTRRGEEVADEEWPMLYHDTTDKQWIDKGEFLCDTTASSVDFIFYWSEGGPKDASAAENLYGRFVSNLMTYFRTQPDFKSIEITIPKWLVNLE